MKRKSNIILFWHGLESPNSHKTGNKRTRKTERVDYCSSLRLTPYLDLDASSGSVSIRDFQKFKSDERHRDDE